MTDLWLVLTPILLSDVLNPVLFAFLAYLAGAPRGALLAALALAGHTLAYLGCGVVIAFGFEQLTAFMANPGPVSYGIELAISLVLLWLAWQSRQPQTAAAQPEDPRGTSPGSAFVTGAIINFVGIPFAVPYFAAIGRILQEDLPVWDSFVVLATYNLLYLLPFLLVPVLTLVPGDRARAIVMRISSALERGADAVMPVVLLLLGIALGADALFYFLTGAGLF